MYKKKFFLTSFVIFYFFLLVEAPSEELGIKLSGSFEKKIASIKTSKANLRSGPGKYYPIKWVYIKKKWPIKIIDQFHHWRKVETINNSKGWFHKSQISSKKTSLIIQPDFLRKKPVSNTRKIAFLSKRLIVDIIKCKIYWCKIEVKDRRFSGWYKKSYLWESDLL